MCLLMGIWFNFAASNISTHKLFFKNLENCLAIHVPISFIVSICMGKYYLFVRYCACIEHIILILM